MKWTEAAKERVRRRNRRIMAIGVIFTVCYMIIGAKAFYIQIVETADLSERASWEYKKEVKTEGRRGTIYDVNMKELAVNTSVVSVGAHPEAFDHPAQAASQIAETLGLSRAVLQKKLSRDAPFVWLERNVSPMQSQALKELGLDGLEYTPGFCRVYPNKTLAAQALGFTGVERCGLEGLESYYNDYLEGNDKQWQIIKDAMGRIFHRETDNTAQREGKNLILTLDSHIQYIAENALEKAVKKFRGRSGMAVVMVPQTGAIRAIAHYPTFDPNSFGAYPRETWRNRSITDAFEPGSTMKVFTAAAALASGKYHPGTFIDCENGRYRTGGHVINDTHEYAQLSLQEVIKYSSNIGAAKIAETIGAENLYDTLRAFGFGEETGIDCPGEASGRLRHYQQWRQVDQATIAFGQGVSVSAVQLISAISAIANKGVLMKPRLVKAIVNQAGVVVESRGPEQRGRAVSAETAEKLTAMMFDATGEEGTGSRAVPAGYKVCGKTGTAQKINSRGTYENCEYKGIFVGFAPRRSPKLAVLVVIDEPQKDHYGGVVAAPAFRDIVLKSFNYMDIPPHQGLHHYNVAVEKREKGA